MNNYLQVRRYSGIAATHFLMVTNWTQSTINMSVLTDFNLLIRENIHADAFVFNWLSNDMHKYICCLYRSINTSKFLCYSSMQVLKKRGNPHSHSSLLPPISDLCDRFGTRRVGASWAFHCEPQGICSLLTQEHDGEIIVL